MNSVTILASIEQFVAVNLLFAVPFLELCKTSEVFGSRGHSPVTLFISHVSLYSTGLVTT